METINEDFSMYYMQVGKYNYLVLDHIPGNWIDPRFKNFSGNKFGDGGIPQFGIIVPPDIAEQLRADGWNVKHRESPDGSWDPYDVFNVNVRYDLYPPVVHVIKENRKNELNKDTIASLDNCTIRMMDVRIQGSWYEDRFTHEKKRSAYVQMAYVYLETDRFADRFEDDDDDLDIPDIIVPPHGLYIPEDM